MNDDIFVHPSSVIDDNVTIGSGTKIWHFCHVVSGAVLGVNCSVGQNCYIDRNVQIGNNVRIQNNVSVYRKVTLEDDVFCGPSMVFTNVLNPRAAVRRNLDEYSPTLVKQGATIGANATVVCGITIGRYAFIGAGAVVTRDVPDYALVHGNPGRIRGWMCECGEKLRLGIDSKNVCEAIACTKCKRRYERIGWRVKEIASST